MEKLDVPEAEGPDDLRTGLDLASRGIHAEERALGQGAGHGNEVRTVGTAQLQDSAFPWIRRGHAEPGAKGAESTHVALGTGPCGIGRLVVG